MVTRKYRKGDCVEYPKAEKWGFGIVLEDCQDEHLRVFFSLGGYKVLPTEGLNLTRVDNRRYLTSKDGCPYCKRQVEDLKKHSGRSKTSKSGHSKASEKGDAIFFASLGGKKVKYKVRPDDPMPYVASWGKENLGSSHFSKGDLVEDPRRKSWGVGTVLEDYQGAYLHVYFSNAGYKYLPRSKLNLVITGRTDKVTCPNCNEPFKDFRNHSCLSRRGRV